MPEGLAIPWVKIWSPMSRNSRGNDRNAPDTRIRPARAEPLKTQPSLGPAFLDLVQVRESSKPSLLTQSKRPGRSESLALADTMHSCVHSVFGRYAGPWAMKSRFLLGMGLATLVLVTVVADAQEIPPPRQVIPQPPDVNPQRGPVMPQPAQEIPQPGPETTQPAPDVSLPSR